LLKSFEFDLTWVEFLGYNSPRFAGMGTGGRRLYYSIVKLLAVLAFKLFVRLEVRGAENVPDTGAFVFASNHQSNLDPFLLGAATRRKLAYFAKAELFRYRIGAFLLRKLNAFPVRRGGRDRDAINRSIHCLESGLGLVFFPEGSRRHAPDGVARAKPGVAMVAARAGAPVVPAHIIGSERVLPPGKALPRPRKVVVTFGPPLDPPDVNGGGGRKEVYLQYTERVLQQIYDLK
jgi:1-acyl-sn-glycerol-3-phosphate acyltransferase